MYLDTNDRAHSLLEELLAFGVSVDTIERALRGAVASERKACSEACQAVIDSGEYDGHQQYAAAARRTAIEARSGDGGNRTATEAQKLESAKQAAHRALEGAEKAWYAYAGLCDVGLERTRAFDVYENVRTARRV